MTRIVAPNPGAMTLDGTNTYIVAGAQGSWVIDPGPADEGHVEAIATAAGHAGIAGIVLTHSHLDHSEAVSTLGAPLRFGSVGAGDESAAESGAAATGGSWPPEPPGTVGPFEIVPTPGHAVDHVCFVLPDEVGSRGAGGEVSHLRRVCFCGDLVLGAGSSFVPPDGGSLAAYMESLRTLRAVEADVLCPGHGPYVSDPGERIDDYIAHRLEREEKLLEALADGERSRAALLDHAWDDVPEQLRPAAAMVMQAHLEKLAAEGRLPDVELIE